MSGPLIPYIKVPEIPLGGLPAPLNSIKPFGLLVATGVYIGAMITLRRARERHLDEAKMNSFILYVVGIGFVGAHVFDAVFYTPERIAENPLYLVQFWAGLSSYGGFIGAICGLFLFKHLKKENVFAYADIVCSAFPISWVFGRAGCASVHDHPGRDTTSWLGVQAYNPRVRDPNEWGFIWDSGQTLGRYDLGFVEFALTIPLAIAFIILWRQKPRSPGFFSGWMCVLYAPVRFPLDFLRIESSAIHDGDPRYLGLTPAQWACFALFALGVYLIRMSKGYPVPPTWEALHAEAERAEAAEKKKAAKEARLAREASDKARVRRRKAAAAVEEEIGDAQPEQEEGAAPKPKAKRKRAKLEPNETSEEGGKAAPKSSDDEPAAEDDDAKA